MSEHRPRGTRPKTLDFAVDLKLPADDAASQVYGFIGRRGAGKTFAAGRLAELLIILGAQVVVLDCVGNWYGLRLAANGIDPGFDVPVLGGLRGDIPLEPQAGALVADVILQTGRSFVLDISQFSLANRKRFATDFGERLWSGKKAQASPNLMHVVLEECQLIIPQRVSSDVARMVGIWEEVVRLGRNFGMGTSMLSQRPQSVNKEALNQIECLVTFQTNGTQERKALRDWVVDKSLSVDLVSELPGLEVGEAFVWSPQWLRYLGKTRVTPKVTYDASATPKLGQKRLTRALATLDLESIRQQMTIVVEQSKRTDPKQLQRRIAELERSLAQAQSGANGDVARVIERQQIELATAQQSVLAAQETISALEIRRDERIDLLYSILDSVREMVGRVEEVISFEGASERLAETSRQLAAGVAEAWNPPKHKAEPLPASPQLPLELPTPNGDVKLGKAERTILTVLAQYGDLRRRKVAIIADYSVTGGAFLNALSWLRGRGCIESGSRGSNNPLKITDYGRQLLGAWAPMPSGREMIDHWLVHPQLGRAERSILAALVDASPRRLGRTELAERASEIAGKADPYSATGGAFLNALSKLRTLELIEGSSELKLSEDMSELANS